MRLDLYLVFLSFLFFILLPQPKGANVSLVNKRLNKWIITSHYIDKEEESRRCRIISKFEEVNYWASNYQSHLYAEVHRKLPRERKKDEIEKPLL